MKKAKFVALATLLLAANLTAVDAQTHEYVVKKDVILKDKVTPYGNLTGKMSVFKPADLVVNALNGDSLMTIKAWEYANGNPKFKDLGGYKVRFIKTGREVILPCSVNLANKSQLMDFIFLHRDFSRGKRLNEFDKDLIVDNAIDTAAESAYVRLYDQAPRVKWAQEFEEKERKILKQLFPMQKDASKPLVLRSIETKTLSDGWEETKDIYQGDQLLVSVLKKKKTDQLGTVYIYTYYRILDEMFEVGGEKVGKVVIATAYMSESFPYMFVNVNGKKQDIHVPSAASAEQEIAEILIQNKKI